MEYTCTLVVCIGNQLERMRCTLIIIRDYRAPINIGNIETQREAHDIPIIHERANSILRSTGRGFRHTNDVIPLFILVISQTSAPIPVIMVIGKGGISRFFEVA